MRRFGAGVVLPLSWMLAAATASLASPSVDLQKTVYVGHDAGGGCPGGELATGTTGMAITYCFVIRNTGDTYLGDITLADGGLGITRAQTTQLSGSEPLAPGFSLTLYYETTIGIDLINTASTTANPVNSLGQDLAGLPNVTDNDTARVDRVAPAVVLQKTVYTGHTGGLGCQGSETIVGPMGQSITYCFLVQNTGDTHLSNLAIDDPALGITKADMTLVLGSEPLAPSGQLLYYYETQITHDVVNSATVIANPTASGGSDLPGIADVTDDDTASVDEFTPPTTSSTTTTSTSTTTTTIQVCHCSSEIPFLARTSAKLSGGSTVDADLGVNSEVGLLKLAPGAVMADGTTVWADRVKLSDGASIDNLRTNLLFSKPTSIIRGSVLPVDLPLVQPFCSVPSPSCGSSTVAVQGSATELTLGSGDYGDALIGGGALLRLTGNGPYRFCNLKLSSGAVLLASTQVTIEVAGQVNVGSGCAIRTTSGAPLVLKVTGSKIRIGREAEVNAAIVAPNARTKVQQSGLLRGCVCTQLLKTARDAQLVCVGGSPSGAFVD